MALMGVIRTMATTVMVEEKKEKEIQPKMIMKKKDRMTTMIKNNDTMKKMSDKPA